MGHKREGRTPKGTWGVRNTCLCALILILAGCTGSSKENVVESDGLILSGSVGDGPIVGADIRIEDADGDLIFEGTSDERANYSFDIPDGTRLPVTVRVSGGTDLVTSRAADFEMLSVAFDSGPTTLNVSPYTTLAVKTARCLGEISPDNIETAWDLIDQSINLGWTRSVIDDPMSEVIGETNVATVLVGNEALGELIRRTAAASTVGIEPQTTDEILGALACDITDGKLDGIGPGVSMRSGLTLVAQATEIGLEVIAGRLMVDDADATDRLDNALATILPGATASVLTLAPPQNLIDQTADRLGVFAGSDQPALLAFAMALEEATENTARGQLAAVMDDPTNRDALSALPLTVATADTPELEALTARQQLPADAPFISFAADDARVSTGTRTRLSWAASNAEQCLASGGWDGERGISGSEQSPPIWASTEFTLTCSGRGGVVTERALVDVANAEPAPAPTPVPVPDPDPAPVPDPAPDPVPAPTPVPVVSFQADRTTVDAGDSINLSWTSTDATACNASGGWGGSRSVSGGQRVGPLASDVTFVLTCTGPGGSDSAVQSITVRQPEPAPTVNLNASAPSVVSGSATTLSWSSSNATACSASGAWSGSRSTTGAMSTGALTASSTFTLTCSGPGGSRSDSVTIQVTQPDAPEVSFNASATQITRGETVRLSWSASDATGCTASGGWSGSLATSGNRTLTPSATTGYSLACSGPGGTDTASVNVIVNTPVPTLSLSASRTTVEEGDSVTLSWSSSDASACSASGGWSGSRSPTGANTVGPLSATTTFGLACSGTGGDVSDTVTVIVNPAPADPPSVSLNLARTSINAGESTTLSWSATNATSCSASGAWSGSRSTSGSVNVSPNTSSTYQLTCSGEGGSRSDSATLNVNAQPPTLSFSSSEDLIAQGGAVTLSWSATDATSCTASGGWSGAKSTSGNEFIGGIDSSTTFSLTCTGPGGNVIEMLTVSTLSSVALNWVAPAENVDGSALTDLAGYRIYYGTMSRSYSEMVEIADPSETSHTLSLASGDYYVAMTALDQEGNESAYSNEVLKTAP